MKNKLASNMVYQLLYQSLVVFFPLLTTPIVSRALGSELLGVYSYTYAIAYYFSLGATLGISTYGSRQIAFNRDNLQKMKSIFWQLYSIQMLCSILVIALYIAYIILFSKMELRITWLLQGTTIIMALTDISWYFTGVEQFKTMVLRNTCIKLLALVAILCLIHEPMDLNLYIIIMNGTNIIGQLLIWPSALKIVGSPHFTLNKFKEHMPYILRLFLPIMASNMYVLIDKTVLGSMRTMTEVGYYENSDKLIKMPIGLASAVSSVLLPRAAYNISHGNREKNNIHVERTLTGVLLFAIPLAIGLANIAPELVPWYFGDEYEPCVDFIQAMCPIIIIMIISNILRLQYYVPNQKDKEYTYCVVGVSVINFVINLFTVKSFGVYGIICGTFIGEGIGMLYLMIKSKKEINYCKIILQISSFFIPAIGMAIGVRRVGDYLGPGIKTNLCQMLTGCVIYGGILLMELGIGYLIKGKIKSSDTHKCQER
ncbi:MAG: oligosaccharide flippase family protein [Frisingicoccus sp.]